MAHNPITELPEPDARDKLHRLIMVLVSPIPYASELIGAIVKPPLDKRYNDWLQSLADGLLRLQEQLDEFSLDELSDNEAFISTLLQATQVALRHHQKELHRALRNAVLNSALPEAPDESRQKMFTQWLEQLTVWHIRILQEFQDPRIPSLKLSDGDWKMDINTDKLVDLLESKYPNLEGQFEMVVTIIGDLHLRGLISNLMPEKDMPTRVEHSPRPTRIAKEFLQFIESPTGDIEPL